MKESLLLRALALFKLGAGRSKHEPHQGKKEMARRRQQIERGILKKENGLR